jgi:hypothetical protein
VEDRFFVAVVAVVAVVAAAASSFILDLVGQGN